MELAIQIVWGILYGGAIFAFKVLVNMIAAAQKKSDEADLRLERAIEKTEEKFRANDHTLFNDAAEVKARISSLEAKIECIQGR